MRQNTGNCQTATKKKTKKNKNKKKKITLLKLTFKDI